MSTIRHNIPVSFNGRIVHGREFLAADKRREPTAYYGRTAGVGQAIAELADGPRHVGLVGLGTGTMATYARKGDHFQFYEINSKWKSSRGSTSPTWTIVRAKSKSSTATRGLNSAASRRRVSTCWCSTHFRATRSRALLTPRGVCHLSSPYGPRRDHCRPHLQQALCPRAGGAGDRRRLPPGDGDDRRALLDGRRFVLELGVGFRLAPRATPQADLQRPPESQTEARVLWTDDHASLFEVLVAGLDDWFARGERHSKSYPGGIEPSGPKHPPAEKP